MMIGEQVIIDKFKMAAVAILNFDFWL